ncbi:MAG TPA: ATP-binding protein, partial [Chthoniobacteraceae bacterium]|nr:ATP-binding protein [Chthoniobacteraceae bacterium]
LPPVQGVESEIRDALTNLIFNAVDAMPDGGTLTIGTRMAKAGRDSKSRGGRNIHVEVTDSGVGMSEETQRRCLEPFYTTKGERGTGLGLAMVYGAMQRHGAELEIDSIVGKGTTMRLIFPVSGSLTATPADPVRAVEPLRRLRLLVVDDDPLLLKSLRDALETDGHVITTCDGGQAGIDAFTTSLTNGQEFAAVITDLGMPYVDGRKVASAIKTASAKTPVIMLTGWGQRLAAEGDMPQHVDLVLGKPPKLRELREALATALAS